MTAEPEKAFTDDRLLGGRVRLRQPVAGYRVALDPVLLAAAIPARSGEHVLDLGCGTGAAALCLLARVAGLRATGLERDAGAASLARENAAANGWSDRFEVIEGDLSAPPAPLRERRFDHVFANPPYLNPAKARLPAETSRRQSHAEEGSLLGDWVDVALRRTLDGGSVTFIHRADRLSEVLLGFEGRAGDIVVFPLWSGGAEAKPAKRVIVQARKGRAAPLCLNPGLVLHRADGDFTAEAESVLRDAACLSLRDR